MAEYLPLCEHCWRRLGSAEKRMPFYYRLVHEMWADPARWAAVQAAILSEEHANA